MARSAVDSRSFERSRKRARRHADEGILQRQRRNAGEVSRAHQSPVLPEAVLATHAIGSVECRTRLPESLERLLIEADHLELLRPQRVLAVRLLPVPGQRVKGGLRVAHRHAADDDVAVRD